MNKKYYWLKLKNDFFVDKRIKKLRKIAGGDTYTIIYLKLMLLSLKNDGKLCYEGVENSFEEEMALELDEDEENVKITIAYLIQNGLLEQKDNEEYELPEAKNCIGSETASTIRSRRARERQKVLQCNTNATQMQQDATKCNIEKEKEKDIELEIDKDIDNYNCYYYFEMNYNRSLTPIEFEKLKSWENYFTDEMIKCAIDISISNNKKSFNYIEGILNNWKSQNIKSVEDILKNEKPKNKEEINLNGWSEEEINEILNLDYLDD